MSKITNDGLTRSGTGCFIAVLIRYDTIGEFNVDSKAEYSALASAHMATVCVKGLMLDIGWA